MTCRSGSVRFFTIRADARPNRSGSSGLYPSVTISAAPAAVRLGAAGMRETAVGPKVLQRAEFERFFAAEYAGLARYCWSLVRNREQAEDLAQEACSLLLGKWSSVQDPKGYAYQVATNLVRRAWRVQALDRRRLHQLGNETADRTPDATQVLVLRDALSRIPRRHRDVVLLHYYAGLSVSEVALAVGRPQGTVKRQLSEARERLLAQLGTEDES
jgi:RNA polymerase sigma-70 factor (ECF subfamily)